MALVHFFGKRCFEQTHYWQKENGWGRIVGWWSTKHKLKTKRRESMSEDLIQVWLKDGDEKSAEALYEAHRSRVYRLAYALLGSADEAELVMQETMVYALGNIQLYDPQRASFDTWLHTLTVSRTRDRGRGLYVRSQADNQASQASQSQVWKVLDQINPQLREALVLRYWGGHTYPEIAQILRCPLPTAQSRVRLGYEQVTKLLGSKDRPMQGE
jgi:RNA polymerase sigma-70 factor (ECF subfamily)